MSIGGQVVNDSVSAVFKAFEDHPEWKNVLIVADWTGSMYPYLGQVMRWHRLNIDKQVIKHIVLFNDGDGNLRSPDSQKIVGRTGGIYHADPLNMADFLEKVKIAVDNGSGDESEENDLEAITEGIRTYDDIDCVVLIADNSEVRDMALLSMINKPVHVVIYDGGYVADYVKIAYQTGGSITTI
ncbi:MAG: hypothetical protein M3Q97_04815, partial [Bacteroidota bacterium]|nr:hypothetical protein [Bacteroidota bacterium]